MLKLKTAILAAALIFGVFAVIPYAQQTTTAPATAPRKRPNERDMKDLP